MCISHCSLVYHQYLSNKVLPGALPKNAPFKHRENRILENKLLASVYITYLIQQNYIFDCICAWNYICVRVCAYMCVCVFETE